ncbi:MAG: serine--tRNA ligase [Armatimonadota bacterium]|nr:serine--tRNA ligase [Armatimonadota bacterium]
MLDLNLIRRDPELVRVGLRRRQGDPGIVDEILEVDRRRRELQQEVDRLRRERKVQSEEIARLPEEEREVRRTGLRELSERLKGLEEQLALAEEELNRLLFKLPNLPSEDTPEGRDASENVPVRSWGEKPKFTFQPLDHVELGKRLGILDLQRGAKVSGSRYYFLKGTGVLLEMALIRLAMDLLVREGFTPVVPPMLVRQEMLIGAMGGDQLDTLQVYRIAEEDLALIGTSEHPMAAMFSEEVLEEEALPIRLAGLSSCFRREAGSYGRDVRGIFRVHQFEKVEMFSFAHPDRSREEHEYLVSLQERFLQSLGLPYRVVSICAGDMGLPAAKQYDIETWMPGRGEYAETHSCSNCTDFQARRLRIRFRPKGHGGGAYVHTLNGTLMASTRTIIAILENFQQPDGSVRIPPVLVPYMNGIEVLTPP